MNGDGIMGTDHELVQLRVARLVAARRARVPNSVTTDAMPDESAATVVKYE